MDFLRQTNIFDPKRYEDTSKVVLIGAGGIGSPTALFLSKMGISEITLIDPDKVEPHNLPNQFYKKEDVGEYKVEALARLLEELSDIKVNTIIGKAEEEDMEGIVVAGVDSMSARKHIWSMIKENCLVSLYIDARMAAQVFAIHSLDPNHIKECDWYESTLYSDEEAASLRCTEKSIIYTVGTTASIICGQVKKFLKKEPYSRKTTFDMVNLFINNETQEEIIKYGKNYSKNV